MTVLLILLGLIAYASVGAWVWGYARGALNDETGWESPAPLMAGLFWPVVLTGICMQLILTPAQELGFNLQQKQMAKKKRRIEIQTKTRIELENAERELEAAYNELEETEKQELKKSKKASVITVPRRR